jgi:hypothetical protein
LIPPLIQVSAPQDAFMADERPCNAHSKSGFPTPPNDPSAETETSDQQASRDALKSAYNAFKKRWKLTRLDQISQIGRGPMSSGQKSAIAGITPPDQFPPAVWDELVKQGRLKYVGAGCYALP